MLNVHFALHEDVKVGEPLESAPDYTLACTDPSAVFRSETVALQKHPPLFHDGHDRENLKLRSDVPHSGLFSVDEPHPCDP